MTQPRCQTCAHWVPMDPILGRCLLKGPESKAQRLKCSTCEEHKPATEVPECSP